METPRANWGDDWSVGVDVRVERRGQAILDTRSAGLLDAVRQTNSISAAARLLGISYAHAWLVIRQADEAAGQSLIETAIGGRRGGGARLSPYGEAALTVFEKLRRDVGATAAKTLPRLLAGGGQSSAVIHLAAAISLQEVVAQVLVEYALLRPTVSVRAVYGASNELADQVLSGAATDVFVSANRLEVDRLARAGLIKARSRRILAKNSLAMVATQDFQFAVRKPADLYRADDVSLVVADPACPLGKCTAAYLESTGTYEKLRPRLVQVDNSRAVVSAIRGRKLGVGLVFTSDVAGASWLRTLFQVPPAKASTVYEAAVLTNAGQADQAAALVDFFDSKQAKACFRRCGFIV